MFVCGCRCLTLQPEGFCVSFSEKKAQASWHSNEENKCRVMHLTFLHRGLQQLSGSGSTESASVGRGKLLSTKADNKHKTGGSLESKRFFLSDL